MKIEVWHGEKHDDNIVTEVSWAGNFTGYLRDLYETGGFRYGNEFVPWHRVNYITVVDE